MGELLVCRQINFYFFCDNCISSNLTWFNNFLKMYRFLKQGSGRAEGAHYCFCFILPAVFWMQSHFPTFQHAPLQGKDFTFLKNCSPLKLTRNEGTKPVWWKAADKVTNSHKDTTCALSKCSQPGQQAKQTEKRGADGQGDCKIKLTGFIRKQKSRKLSLSLHNSSYICQWTCFWLIKISTDHILHEIVE